MTSRARGEVIAALLVVALFCAVVGPVWWRRWQDGTLGTAPVPAPVSPVVTPSVAGQRAATVVRVSDGDTVILRLSGRETTVRILNIDTPETQKAGTPVECLGPEASRALASLLPVGKAVEIAHDGPRKDRYGRTLAAVWADGRLVAEQMAKQGWSGAAVVSRADTWYAPVAAAQQEAIAARRGLYDPSIPCTLAGQTATRVTSLRVEAATTPAQLEARRRRLTTAIAQSEALRASLAPPDSQLSAIQRQRHPAAWRYARVRELDGALATARAALR
ncbi:nuclease-like protein [Luteococcus japonicus]|uniref:Nuclease-like protein n=1 Tax=Luteococcus japonicus TaxID=33984 RepID=A0A3N1ZYJ2_9ACTN|nr:thermonuclease family protein [Luteococcus japonicus]ROR55202.1 nuclease-like protein [Luteococcus japonicus]